MFNIQNYIITTLVAVFTYYWVGFDFIDYIIFLIVAAAISVFFIAFGGGEKIAYSKFKDKRGGTSESVDVHVSTFKYIVISLLILGIISGFLFMVMYVIGITAGFGNNPFSKFNFEVSGLLINLLPFLINIFVNKNTEGWLPNLKGKYYFVLAASIFIPAFFSSDIIRVIVISLLFAYTTDAQGKYIKKKVPPFAI